MRTITMNFFRKHPDGRLQWLACYQISEDLAANRIDKEFSGPWGVLVWEFAYRHDHERLVGKSNQRASAGAGRMN